MTQENMTHAAQLPEDALETDDLNANLARAAQAADPHAVAHWLTQGANARMPRPGGAAHWTSPLCLAAFRGSAPCVELLIPHSDANWVSAGGTALHYAVLGAVLGGSAACVEALLPHCDARVPTPHGLTALMNAAAGDNPLLVSLLLPVSDPDAVSEDGNGDINNALSHALANKRDTPENREIVNMLVEATQNLDYKNSGGQTALMVGVDNVFLRGDPEKEGDYMYLPLLGRADANVRDPDGMTALEQAAQVGDLGQVKALLPFTDVANQPEDTVSAIRLAARGDFWNVADFLAPFSPRSETDWAFDCCGRGRDCMPVWAAHVEAEELQSVVNEASRMANPEEGDSSMGAAQALATKRAPRAL